MLHSLGQQIPCLPSLFTPCLSLSLPPLTSSVSLPLFILHFFPQPKCHLSLSNYSTSSLPSSFKITLLVSYLAICIFFSCSDIPQCNSPPSTRLLPIPFPSILPPPLPHFPPFSTARPSYISSPLFIFCPSQSSSMLFSYISF